MVSDARSVADLAVAASVRARSFRPAKTPRKPTHASSSLSLARRGSVYRNGVSRMELVAEQSGEEQRRRRMLVMERGRLSVFRDSMVHRRRRGEPETQPHPAAYTAPVGRESEAQKVEQVAEVLMMSRRMGDASTSKFSTCPKKRKQRMRVPQTDRACDYCGTSSTAQWRSGPVDFPVLCNACGVRHRKGKLQVRGGLPLPQKALGCNLLANSSLTPFPSLAPICTLRVPSPSKDSKIDIMTPTSCLEVSKLGKRTRSGSLSGSSGQSGQAILALSHTCAEGTAQHPLTERNKFFDDDYCYNLRWGTKRRRSGL